MYINLMTGFPWETPAARAEHDGSYRTRSSRWSTCSSATAPWSPYPNTALYEEYKDSAGFADWWLRPRYQDAGMVIFQNVQNPYEVTSYFQRNLYDDTYIYEDYFFRYTPEYKRKVRDMLFMFGRLNLRARYHSPMRQWLAYGLGKVSRFFYEIDPRIERRLVRCSVRRTPCMTCAGWPLRQKIDPKGAPTI